jgi:hypothetical protein
MSQWEAVEFELARLYTVFVRDPDGESIQDPKGYGSGRIFQDRLTILRETAGDHFRRHPNQAWEGGFTRVANLVLGFSDRRNEAAHGYVMPMENNTYVMQRMGKRVGGPPQHLLVPPLHTIRKHDGGLPKYAYSSAELKELTDRLVLLWAEVSDYRRALLAAQQE